jgi:hypothetical protein
MIVIALTFREELISHLRLCTLSYDRRGERLTCNQWSGHVLFNSEGTIASTEEDEMMLFTVQPRFVRPR